MLQPCTAAVISLSSWDAATLCRRAFQASRLICAQKAVQCNPDRCREDNLWDQPPSQLEVLERTPEQRWDDGRDSQHLSHDCGNERGSLESALPFTAVLSATRAFEHMTGVHAYNRELSAEHEAPPVT